MTFGAVHTRWTDWAVFSRFMFIFVMFACLNTEANSKIERPLIVIPGVLGSKLGNQQCTQITWGDRESLWLFENLRLQPDGSESVQPHKPCGLIEHVQILGPLKVDAYSDLLQTLARLGYKEGDNLFLFPYDWRRSNFDTARVLQTFLDSPTLAGREVDIVAHSMGGVIARIYIQEMGGSRRVKRLLTMGTPHLGAARMLEVVDEGWGFWANLLAGGLGNVRSTALSFPSIFELMPHYNYCCVVGYPGSPEAREISALDSELWYSMPWLPSSMNTSLARNSLGSALESARRLKEVMNSSIPRSVDLYPFCTGLFDTTWRVHFDPNTGRIISRSTGKGDGTVPIRSAGNGRLDHCRASLSEHTTIFADDAARQHLEWILRPDLHPFEPRSGVRETDIALRLETPEGRRPGVSRVGISFQPSTVVAGQSFEVEVGLFGENELNVVDIRGSANVRQASDGGQFVRVACSPSFLEAKHCLKGRLIAPTIKGPTWVDIQLPGIDVISDVILVM